MSERKAMLEPGNLAPVQDFIAKPFVSLLSAKGREPRDIGADAAH